MQDNQQNLQLSQLEINASNTKKTSYSRSVMGFSAENTSKPMARRVFKSHGKTLKIPNILTSTRRAGGTTIKAKAEGTLNLK